jgi:hypothetical protein
MRTYVIAIAVLAGLYLGWGQLGRIHEAQRPAGSGNETVATAFSGQKSGVQVAGEGVVTTILPDDDDGSRHQRFILRLASGQTLLVSHNIDLAPRLASLKPGDVVAFNGVYEWNERGGLVHWTHHDPAGRHRAGWLRHNGEVSQ